MRTELQTVVVFDQKLYNGTGLVGRWLTGIERTASSEILRRIPRRTNALAESFSSYSRRTGPRRREIGMGVDAEHSRFVLFGTASQGRNYIYSDAGWANKSEIDRVLRHVPGHRGLDTSYLMPLRTGTGARYAARVHGQKANNFLVDGYNATARKHRALRRIPPGYIRRR